MNLSAVLTPDPVVGYVALNPETGTASQGGTIEDALANLREAVDLYLEEFPLDACGPSLFTTLNLPGRA